MTRMSQKFFGDYCTDMKPRCIAVIGCGTIANGAHFPSFGAVGGVRDKYAVDLIEERARTAKEKWGCENALTDYKQALADKEVEAVYVLTPNYSHYTITMDALGAGKHVFCEKPVTVNYKLGREMQDLANKKKLILNIGVCNRFNKSVELLKQLNEGGEFGELYHVYCSFRDHRCIPGLGGDFTTKAKSGGGVLIDWGVHFLDLILYITGGKAKTVTAECYSKLAQSISDYTYVSMWAGPPKIDGINDVEEFVSGFVRTDKADISLNGAWAQNIGKREMFVDFLGTSGGARLQYGEKFTLYRSRNGTLEEISHAYNMPCHYEEENKAFFQSIASGKKNRAHIDSVIETAKVMDAIYQSAEKGAEVKL